MKTSPKQWKERSGAEKRGLSAYLKAFQSTSAGTFLVLPAKHLLTTHFQIKKESRMAHQLGKDILQARQTDSQACIIKKKFHREIVCQTQELMPRLCNLLPGVFRTWPDKAQHNCSGFQVSPAQTRGCSRQSPGGPFEPKLSCNSLWLYHSQTQLNSAPPTSSIRHGRESLWSCRATRNTFLDAPCV